MRQVMFKYYMQHEDTGNIVSEVYELEEIESYDGVQEPYRFFTIGRCQFTGLFDKQGVEIYEGDIVKDCDSESLEVYFHHGCWMIKYVRNNNSYKNLHFYRLSIEVIGNIYENQELIK